MDRGLAEANASLAFATLLYDDFAVAEREFERSIALNPRYATAHHLFGWCLALIGRCEEGYTELKRAIRLDPCSSVLYWGLGFVYRRARRYDQAIEQYEKSLELDPNSPHGQGGLGLAYLEKSLYEPAIAALRKGVELSQSAPVFVAALGEAYAAAGCPEEAQKILQQLSELSKQRYVSPYAVGRLYDPTAVSQPLVVIRIGLWPRVIQEMLGVERRGYLMEDSGRLAEVETVGEIIRLSIRVVQRPKTKRLFDELQDAAKIVSRVGDVRNFRIG